jgi:hypothetical protein
LRKFKVNELHDEKAVDLRGRPVYDLPWAVPEAAPVVSALERFVKDSALEYLDKIPGEGFYNGIFRWAASGFDDTVRYSTLTLAKNTGRSMLIIR